MSEPLLTKRLHISGLTPSITPGALERRLSSFGKVKAMDGFGARDALGDPRKFGFVTIEIGAKDLAKCLNALSGSTWKGAKLRIGEAKPGFRERLAQLNSRPPRLVGPKRTRARNHGYLSSALPLTPLTATAAASTPGWIVAASGRVVRPMRMRPVRPLEPMGSELGTLKGKAVNGRAKTRVKPPPVRARRRLIDPTKWDSEYLKGVFLDAVPMPLPSPRGVPDSLGHLRRQRDDDEDEEEGDGDSTDGDPSSGVLQLSQNIVRVGTSARQSQEAASDKDVEMDEIGSPVVQATNSAPMTDLKTLFAPREDASFSLLNHLDLDFDLELGADVLGINAPTFASEENAQWSQPALEVAKVPSKVSTTKARPRVTLDPSAPLLFPLPSSLPHAYTHSSPAISSHGAPTCLLFPTATRAGKVPHLPPSSAFTRSPQDTPDSIRERWEKDKLALTREWKKAWRDARGSRRGGRGARDEFGSGY